MWTILEFNREGYKLNIKQIIKFIYHYILPTLITVIICSFFNNSMNSNIKDTLKFIIIINCFYIGIIQFFIQKNFFMNLNKDVILKFIWDRANDYVILKLFIIIIKAYLPVIVPSIIILYPFFINSKIIFYLSVFMVAISIIIISVLFAIWLRYFTNTTKKILVKIFNFIGFLYLLILFFVTSAYTPIWILNNLAASLKHKDLRGQVELNIFMLLMFMLISLLSIFILNYSKDYFKVRARVLILNRELNTGSHNNKINGYIEKIYERVGAIHLSDLEGIIFNKDIKEVIRRNKYSLLFISINQIINIAIILFINFAEKIGSIEQSIFISKLITVIIIGQVIIAFLMSRSFENHINIDEDYEVLEKYGIKFVKKQVIKSKVRLLSIMVFPNIYLIFFILILSSLLNLNNYLALNYLLSMVQLVFIKMAMEYWRVKSTNGISNKSELMQVINGTYVAIAAKIFIEVYKYTNELQYIKGQLVLIIITAVFYVFHSRFNNKTSKGEK